jgi:hypothetical protein
MPIRKCVAKPVMRFIPAAANRLFCGLIIGVARTTTKAEVQFRVDSVVVVKCRIAALVYNHEAAYLWKENQQIKGSRKRMVHDWLANLFTESRLCL